MSSYVVWLTLFFKFPRLFLARRYEDIQSHVPDESRLKFRTEVPRGHEMILVMGTINGRPSFDLVNKNEELIYTIHLDFMTAEDMSDLVDDLGFYRYIPSDKHVGIPDKYRNGPVPPFDGITIWQLINGTLVCDIHDYEYYEDENPPPKTTSCGCGV